MKKLKKKYTGRGYIQKEYKAPKILYASLWSLTEGLGFEGTLNERTAERKNYHRFLAHLYASMKLQGIGEEEEYDPEKFIPIYSRLIDYHFRKVHNGFSLRLLADAKIIEIRGHGTVQRRSRKYRLAPNIFEKARSLECKTSDREWDNPGKGKSITKVNLMTGRRTKTPVKSQLNHYKSGSRDVNTPIMIKKSIKSLKPCPFNPKYIRIWVAKLKKKYEREDEKFRKVEKRHGEKSPIYIKARREWVLAEKRYANDSHCLEVIQNQIPKLLPKTSKKGDPLCKYLAAYTPQTSGRITERFGGFQSASQYFKHQFFRGMSGMYYNYDLKNSQAAILLQELKACNKAQDLKPKLKTDWLEDYLDDPNKKERIAKKIGIKTELWKTCFYATIMGAEAKTKRGAIYKAIKEEYPDDIEKIEAVHRRLLREAKELIEVTEDWRDYIYQTKNRRYHYQHGEVKYWKNACKMHYTDFGVINKKGKTVLTDRRNGVKIVRSKGTIDQCKRKLAAFILQGKEAYFIHNLTILCSENDIPVYKNEHDGIITGEKVPRRLVVGAAKKAKLENPILEIKELCSRDKRLEMRKYVKS